jgi:uncharacterized membrane protein YhaH (DUF805 family)
VNSKKVGFIEAIRRGFQGYVQFRGTASRSEYWLFILFTLLLGAALSTIEDAVWPAPTLTGDALRDIELVASQPTPLTSIASLALLLPTLALTSRRFHDSGLSAKWLFLWLAPLAYGIFATIGAALIIGSGTINSIEDSVPLIFLFLPLPALAIVILVVQLIFTLRPTRSFYDGNKYAEPEPLPPLSEGTTA